MERPAITALNPGLNLPSTDIAVVHRSDGSGTTYIFTNYLCKVSSDWRPRSATPPPSSGPATSAVRRTTAWRSRSSRSRAPSATSSLAYAIQNNLAWASMQNKAGNYVQPTLDSTTAASTGVTIPDDTKIMITDSTNPDAYPIVGFTWILAYVNQPDKAKGEALVYYLWWSIHDGQQYSTALLYASLSPDVVKKAEAEIKSITYQGQPLLQLP